MAVLISCKGCRQLVYRKLRSTISDLAAKPIHVSLYDITNVEVPDMHNKQVTDRMISAFLARKAEEHPEIFNDAIPDPARHLSTSKRLIDDITR